MLDQCDSTTVQWSGVSKQTNFLTCHLMHQEPRVELSPMLLNSTVSLRIFSVMVDATLFFLLAVYQGPKLVRLVITCGHFDFPTVVCVGT